MILLGSMQRDELTHLAHSRLSRERRLQEVRRRHSVVVDARTTLTGTPHKSVGSMNGSVVPRDIPVLPRKMSRFAVTPVSPQADPVRVSPEPIPKMPKSILKQTVSFTYSPNSTIATL